MAASFQQSDAWLSSWQAAAAFVEYRYRVKRVCALLTLWSRHQRQCAFTSTLCQQFCLLPHVSHPDCLTVNARSVWMVIDILWVRISGLLVMCVQVRAQLTKVGLILSKQFFEHVTREDFVNLCLTSKIMGTRARKRNANIRKQSHDSVCAQVSQITCNNFTDSVKYLGVCIVTGCCSSAVLKKLKWNFPVCLIVIDEVTLLAIYYLCTAVLPLTTKYMTLSDLEWPSTLNSAFYQYV